MKYLIFIIQAEFCGYQELLVWGNPPQLNYLEGIMATSIMKQTALEV